MPPLGSNVGHRPSAQVLHRAMPATTRATPGRTNLRPIVPIASRIKMASQAPHPSLECAVDNQILVGTGAHRRMTGSAAKQH